MNASKTDFDAIISGSGLVGAAIAIGLADAGWRIAVIEPTLRSQEAQPSHDGRTLVLNAASLNILNALGLMDSDLSPIPIDTIVINRLGGFGHLNLTAKDYVRFIGEDTDQTAPYFGKVIVASALGQAMLKRLTAHPNVVEYCPERLVSFQMYPSHVEVQLASDQMISGGLLIGADGTHSTVRQGIDAEVDFFDYQQSAMVFNVASSQPLPHTAFERFTPQGPLALLPQANGRYGVVWIDRHEMIDTLMSCDDAVVLSKLQRRFGTRLGKFSRPSARARYPLIKQHTPDVTQGRVVLVGNAANTVHPVSAQGFNLGLRDAAALIDSLVDTGAKSDTSLADMAQRLERYQSIRLPDQQATCRYTDTLARSFAHPLGWVRLMSGFGLAAHAASPTLKRRLVRAAMGFREPVSSLARPYPPPTRPIS